MHTVVYMKEYINSYVRSQPIEKIGRTLLEGEFQIPFEAFLDGENFLINKVAMTEDEALRYIKEFFEELDTQSIIDVFNKIKV